MHDTIALASEKRHVHGSFKGFLSPFLTVLSQEQQSKYSELIISDKKRGTACVQFVLKGCLFRSFQHNLLPFR